MSKFIQPVSMRVTREQYEKDLRAPLLAMGYEEKLITSFADDPILVNNYIMEFGKITNLSEYNAKAFNRHFIPDYNPEYFLAVAAMTNEAFGIVGEWWNVKSKNYHTFINNKTCKCVGHDYDLLVPIFISNVGIYDGLYITPMLEYIEKATLSDLIAHFEPKFNNKNTMTELTQQEKEVLVKLVTKENEAIFEKLVTKENEAIFEKLGIKRDKNPIKELKSDNHAKEVISEYVVMVVDNAREMNKPELIRRAFTMSSEYSHEYKFVLHEKNGLQVLAIGEK